MNREMIHFWNLAVPGDLSACGEDLAAIAQPRFADRWANVTCSACLAVAPGTLAGHVQQRARMLAECERVAAEAQVAIEGWLETRDRALRLASLLRPLSEPLAPQKALPGETETPEAFLASLRPYAAAQRGVKP